METIYLSIDALIASLIAQVAEILSTLIETKWTNGLISFYMKSAVRA